MCEICTLKYSNNLASGSTTESTFHGNVKSERMLSFSVFVGLVSDDLNLPCQMWGVSIRNNWSINATSEHMNFFEE